MICVSITAVCATEATGSSVSGVDFAVVQPDSRNMVVNSKHILLIKLEPFLIIR
jgi:hypothetical protein